MSEPAVPPAPIASVPEVTLAPPTAETSPVTSIRPEPVFEKPLSAVSGPANVTVAPAATFTALVARLAAVRASVSPVTV